MCMTVPHKTQSGFTLVELVISMVIIAICLTGIFQVVIFTTQYSADPLMTHQAVAIAESYLEEILSHPYSDPSGPYNESARDVFDDVGDYDGLNDTGVHDREGNVVSGLTAYNVMVAVDNVNLDSGVKAKKITVTVTPPAGSPLQLTGYRAEH